MPSLFETLESVFGTRDLYVALGLAEVEGRGATTPQIRKAYHKASLRCHPDRVSPEKRGEATRRFQALGAVYKVLSDPGAKALYDESGEIDEENDFDDNRDWGQYWRLLFEKVAVPRIRKFESEYRFSAEEEEDLKKAYLAGNGDMGFVIDNVLCSTGEDEERFAGKIAGWIKDGTVPEFRDFEKSMSKPSKQRRAMKRRKEAMEAEAYAEKLGRGSSKSDLTAMIKKRQESRAKQSDDFIDSLAAKYAKPARKKGSGKR